MTWIKIDVDDDLVETAMRKYDLSSPSDAVNFALRRLVGTPVSTELTPETKEFLLSLQGMGWEGDLDEMRNDRVEVLDETGNDTIDRSS